MAIVHVVIIFGLWGRHPAWMNVPDDSRAQTGYNNSEWVFCPIDPRGPVPDAFLYWPRFPDTPALFLGPGSNVWYQLMLAILVLGTVEELDDIFYP